MKVHHITCNHPGKLIQSYCLKQNNKLSLYHFLVLPSLILVTSAQQYCMKSIYDCRGSKKRIKERRQSIIHTFYSNKSFANNSANCSGYSSPCRVLKPPLWAAPESSSCGRSVLLQRLTPSTFCGLQRIARSWLSRRFQNKTFVLLRKALPN